jgi:hypothetical protein
MLKSTVSSLLTGLYAVYKGESNANDSLGTYNGTAQGGLTYSAGKSGNAFTFNGTNAYVSLPNNSMNFTGDFSINLWVNIVENGTLQTLLACKAYDGINAWGFSLFNIGTTRFDISNGTSTGVTLVEPGTNNPYNTWYMITITRKTSTGTKIYYNGTLTASNTSTVNPVYNPTTNKCTIGAYDLTYPISVGVLYYCANGTKIDELNVWNKELTSTEVTTLYNTGAGKFYPTF